MSVSTGSKKVLQISLGKLRKSGDRLGNVAGSLKVRILPVNHRFLMILRPKAVSGWGFKSRRFSGNDLETDGFGQTFAEQVRQEMSVFGE